MSRIVNEITALSMYFDTFLRTVALCHSSAPEYQGCSVFEPAHVKVTAILKCSPASVFGRLKLELIAYTPDCG